MIFNCEERIQGLKSTFEENEKLVKTLPGVKVSHKEDGYKFLEIFEIPLTNAEEWDSAMAHELFPDNTTIRADWDHTDSIELVDYDDLTVDYMIRHYKHYEWNIQKAPSDLVAKKSSLTFLTSLSSLILSFSCLYTSG